jgi:hypothetical protein
LGKEGEKHIPEDTTSLDTKVSQWKVTLVRFHCRVEDISLYSIVKGFKNPPVVCF